MGTLNDYRDREHWSFSALNQFLNICSLQYFFDRVAKLPKAFTPVSLSFGSAFHRATEWVHLTRKDGRIPEPKESGELFADIWTRQLEEDKDIRFDEDQDAETCRTQGMDMVSAYVRQLDPNERVLAVNEAFAVPLADSVGNVLERPLVGEIDFLVERDGVIVCDMKSSGRRWPKGQADKSMQATAYLFAFRHLHATDAAFRFDVVTKAKIPVVEQHVTRREPDHFHRMVELVKVVERMVAAGHFLPNEQGFYCSGCPHQAACKTWHRQAARKTITMAA